MSRLFPEHEIREVRSLDGLWSFALDRDNKGEELGWQKTMPECDKIAVPSVWNLESGLYEYEGTAWYSKEFYTKGGTLRFHFGAVMTECKVWLDGEYLGYHYGGFCEFEFISSDVSAGYHTLTLKVTNKFDEHSIPQAKVDWYHFGGIIRSVEVERLFGISVIANHLEYTLSDDLKSLVGRFTIELFGAGDTGCDTVKISVGDALTACYEVSVSKGERKTVVLPDFEIHNVALWDIFKPNLYSVKITTSTDDLFDRVGFRKIEPSENQILLNGKPVEIKGVNRHEEHPDFGFAFPLSRMKRDIDLILDMGCNAIRGSHYPNSREFVDYLDELGILFWSEIPIWGGGFSQEALGDKIVVERGLEMHREMVKHYYNHPSIIFWGMHNEILTYTEESLEMTKTYYDYLKREGGNRLVVYAVHQPLVDICTKYTDVLCLNMYFGWYSGGFEVWDKFIDEYVEYTKKCEVSDKPIIFSEFGAAALYGFHDSEMPKWSEEYQADLIKKELTLFKERKEICGSFIWQFCDIRTASEMGLTRARGFNNKGLLNENRRPKAAYYAAKEVYTRE